MSSACQLLEARKQTAHFRLTPMPTTTHQLLNVSIFLRALKGAEFDVIFKYIGFLWYIDEKSVALPDEKRIKFLNRVQTFSSFSSRTCMDHSVMSRTSTKTYFLIFHVNDNRYRRLQRSYHNSL